MKLSVTKWQKRFWFEWELNLSSVASYYIINGDLCSCFGIRIGGSASNHNVVQKLVEGILGAVIYRRSERQKDIGSFVIITLVTNAAMFFVRHNLTSFLGFLWEKTYVNRVIYALQRINIAAIVTIYSTIPRSCIFYVLNFCTVFEEIRQLFRIKNKARVEHRRIVAPKINKFNQLLILAT